jgi:peptidoglycan/LPS O-acetylase OafA/YrhL
MHPSLRQIPALTGLRGYAVLSVLLYHLVGISPELMDLGYGAGVGRFADWGIINHILSFGSYGVDVFFILSGFVIAYNYLDYLNHHLLSKRTIQYLALRIVRIYPAYFVSLLALVLMSAAGIWVSPLARPEALIYHFTLTYAWWLYPSDYGESWNLPAWSLSAEFFSYFVFPVLVVLISRLKKVNECVVLSLFLCLSVQVINLAVLGPRAMMRAVPNFVLGCLTYRIYTLRPEHRYGAMMALTGIVMLIVSKMLPAEVTLLASSFSVWLIVLGLAWTMVASSGGKLVTSLFANRFMLFMGRISYSIYIVHFPCLVFLKWLNNEHLHLAPVLQGHALLVLMALGVVMGFIIVMATLLYTWIEKPAIAFFKKRIR